MPNDSGSIDPKAIWQSQPREVSTAMLEKMVRRKAQELRRKTRRELLGSFAAPVAVAAFSAIGVSLDYNPLQRVAFALAMAWSLAGVYVLNRGTWPAKIAGDAALATGLEFCRREIQQQRDLSRRFLRWSFGPIVLAIGALIVPAIPSALRGGGALPKMTPFFTLLALWMIGLFAIRRSRRRELDREIDELNDIEKEHSR